MPIVLDGTNGINTPDLESAGPISGTTGTFSGALRASGVDTNIYPLVSGTAVASTSGTSIDFTGIPAYVKRITVIFQQVSLSATASFLVQAGVGGTPTTTGYSSITTYLVGGVASGQQASTSGFQLFVGDSGYQMFGHLVLTNVSGNTWVASGVQGNVVITAFSVTSSGVVALGGVLGMLRVTTSSGTDTFDAGSINILYE